MTGEQVDCFRLTPHGATKTAIAVSSDDIL